jgi:hypothetical protein
MENPHIVRCVSSHKGSLLSVAASRVGDNEVMTGQARGFLDTPNDTRDERGLEIREHADKRR